jgi:hypothetical protein
VISGLILRAIIDSVKPFRIHFGDRPEGFAKGGFTPPYCLPDTGITGVCSLALSLLDLVKSGLFGKIV